MIIQKITKHLVDTNYVRNFSWMGRPILQLPSDMFVVQELIWKVKPDFIVETGTAHGGTAVFYASILDALGKGTVITVDIDFRVHNYEAILSHPMGRRIIMVEGDSSSLFTANEVSGMVGKKNAMVMLDSHHTHVHVLNELERYSPLVQKDSYIIVFDTTIETMLTEKPVDRKWGPGNNPMTAVHEFLRTHNEFVIDFEPENKAVLTSAANGFLRRV